MTMKRIGRAYPWISNWSCEFEVDVIDPRITRNMLAKHFTVMGKYIGLGHWRPQKGGLHGRFIVELIRTEST